MSKWQIGNWIDGSPDYKYFKRKKHYNRHKIRVFMFVAQHYKDYFKYY